MSEPKYREWILDTIDSLRSRKARPDLERICRMVRRRHGSEPDRTCVELEKLIQERTVLKVNYKGSISYRNAAKVQRRGRKNDDHPSRGTVVEEASHSDLSNGDDSALGPAEQDETEDLEAEVPVSMDTDSTIEEEGEDGAQDGPNGTSPSPGDEDAVQGGSVHPYSAPCSPMGTHPGTSHGSDHSTAWKSSRRSSSLPPSSPLALRQNDCVCDSAFCPAEHEHPGMQKDKAEASKVAVQKSSVTKENGVKMEESALTSDQLVPDCLATLQDETIKVLNGGPQPLLPLPLPLPQPLPLPLLSGDCAKPNNMVDVGSFMMAQDNVQNGEENREFSVKKETTRQNLLQWSVTDVASYFSAAGFPEQAMAFRTQVPGKKRKMDIKTSFGQRAAETSTGTQEIDGKSLLLMQRIDVLTGMSIRLGPALKIYERHVKVLQRTHFLDDEDDL